MSNNGNITGGRALTRWLQTDAIQGSLIQKLIGGMNNLARNAGVSPTGQLTAPLPPNSLIIKAAGGVVHAQITDNNPLQKPIHYFLEHDTDPNLTQPHVVHMGPSRNVTLTLPANDDNGRPQPWHFQAYAQYPGSQASSRIVYGGATGAIPVSVGGGVNMTLPPSMGSGTAAPNGTQGGQGFGNNNTRPAVGPKRSVGQ